MQQPRITKEIKSQIPALLLSEASDFSGVFYLIISLLIDRENKATRDKQLDILQSKLKINQMNKCREIFNHLIKLDDKLYLPIFEIAYPSYTSFSVNQKQLLLNLAKQLISADNKCNIFEYALLIMLQQGAGHKIGIGSQPKKDYLSTYKLVTIVISAFANFSISNKNKAKDLFTIGIKYIYPHLGENSYIKDTTLDFFDYALTKLIKKNDFLKIKIYNACLKMAKEDKQITQRELEALRAIAGVFDIPAAPYPYN